MKNWENLFEPTGGKEASLRQFFIVRKRGLPFLYLPENRALLDATLRLYPAQTRSARAKRNLVSRLSRMGLQVFHENITISVSPHSRLGGFFRKLVPGCENVPSFGVLGGNVKTLGRRYTFLLFDLSNRPVVVVKLGISEHARHLIRAEQDFFFPQAPGQPGTPEALDLYRGEDADAIAYRYVEGICPSADQDEMIEQLLSAWVHPGKPVGLSELAIWPRLEKLHVDNPGLEPVFAKLQKTPIRPVLHHGDFAPWNIRISPSGGKSHWVVLDWERNQPCGLPGWDWFHYVIQYDTLVRHSLPEVSLSHLETLWTNPSFQRYARLTGIEEIVKELTLIYFLYLLYYVSPSDNAMALSLLAEKFRQTYFPQLPMAHRSLTISVVTPSDRQLPWLKLCVASVADQKGIAVEHLIQDNQSGPELENWVRTHSQAQLKVETDSGLYDAINRGFARSTGDIVCWLNSDDQYLDGALAKVVLFFEMHPEVDVLFGDTIIVSNEGRLLSYRRSVLPDLHHIYLSHLNVHSSSTFVRRSVLERGHRLDVQWTTIADAVWITDLLKAKIPMAVLNEPLSAATISDHSLGQTSLAAMEARRWQEEMFVGMPWMRSFVVLRHRMRKLRRGAYCPRKVSARLYTLSSPVQRILQTAFLGFKWPKST